MYVVALLTQRPQSDRAGPFLTFLSAPPTSPVHVTLTLTRYSVLCVIKIMTSKINVFISLYEVLVQFGPILLRLIPFKGPLTASAARRPAAKWPCDDWLWAGLGSAANRKFPLLCLSERKMSVCHPRCSLPLFPTHTETAWHAVSHRPDQRLTSFFPQQQEQNEDLTV